MPTPIIKVPIYYNNNAVSQFQDSGGESTSLIELPSVYIIGGYKYSKSNLAPIKNGLFGLLPEGTTANVNSAGNNYRAIHSAMTYYAGGQFRATYLLNKESGSGFHRRVNGIQPYVRDNQNLNILYSLLLPSISDSKSIRTLAKINTDTQEIEWRIVLDNNILNETEYLMQDSESLYFLTCGTTVPTSNWYTGVYITVVNKNTGAIVYNQTINNALLGKGNATGLLYYKFLGFVNQDEFLLEFYQNDRGYDAYIASNPLDTNSTTINASTIDCIVKRYIIKYNLRHNTFDVLFEKNTGTTPYTNIASAHSFDEQYKVFGTSIIDDLNSQFMAYDTFLFTPSEYTTYAASYNSETIHQLIYNSSHTEIIDDIILPVYNGYNWPNIINPMSQFYNMNNMPWNTRIIDTYHNPMMINNFSRGFATNTDLYTSINAQVSTALRKNEPFSDISDDYNSRYYHKWSRNYEYIKTERNDTVLRVNQIELGHTRPTEHLGGQDLIYDAVMDSVVFSTFGYDNNATAGQYRYPDLGIDIYTPVNGQVVSANYNSGLAGPSYGIDTNTYPMATAYPLNSVFQFRRGYPNVSDSPILKNGKNIPIYATGYSITADVTLSNSPSSWLVEAHDIETNEWIIIDTQNNQHLIGVVENKDANKNATGRILASQNVTTMLNAYTNIYYNTASTLDGDRGRRTFYKLNNFDELCPQGAYAIRFTFIDSHNHSTVGFKNLSVLEKPQNEYEPLFTNMSNLSTTQAGVRVTGTDGTAAVTFGALFGNTANVHSLLNRSFYTDVRGGGYDEALSRGIDCTNTSMFATIKPAVTYEFYINNSAIKAKMDAVQITLDMGSIYKPQPSKWFLAISDNKSVWEEIATVSNEEIKIKNFLYKPMYEILSTKFNYLNEIADKIIEIENELSIEPPISIIFNEEDDIEDNYSKMNILCEHLHEIDNSFEIEFDDSLISDAEGKDIIVGYLHDILDKVNALATDNSIATLSIENDFYNFSVTNSDEIWLIVASTPGINSFSVNAGGDGTTAGLITSFGNMKKRGRTWIIEFNKTIETKYMKLQWSSDSVNVATAAPGTGVAKTSYDQNWYINAFVPLRKNVNRPPVNSFPARVLNGLLSNGEAATNTHFGAFSILSSDGIGNPTLMFDDLRSYTVGIVGNSTITAPSEESPKYIILKTGTSIYDDDYALNESYIYGMKPNEVYTKPLYAQKYKIVAYKLMKHPNYNPTQYGLTKWKIYGSNNNIDWTLIDDKEYNGWDEGIYRENFLIDTPGLYEYYKFEFLGVQGNSGNSQVSIQLFLEEITENNNSTIHYVFKNNIDDGSTLSVNHTNISLDKGSIIRDDNINKWGYKTRFVNSTHLQYDNEDDTISFIFDTDKNNNNSLYSVNTLRVNLNSAMEEIELPKNLTLYGSNNNETWTLIHKFEDIEWSEYPTPYTADLIFTNNTIYKYFKVVIEKPEIENLPITEYWLLLSANNDVTAGFIAGDNEFDWCRQNLYKIHNQKWLTHVNCENKNIYGNFWIGDNEWMQVCSKNIYVKNVDPITQTQIIKRTIPIDGSCINSACLDSNKNLWLWSNTSPDNQGVGSAKNYRAYLAIQPQYGELKVNIEPEASYKVYEGDSVTTFVKVWIFNIATNNNVIGKIKLDIIGSDAIFEDTENQTIDIEITEDDVTDNYVKTVNIISDNPTKVDVIAYLVKE